MFNVVMKVSLETGVGVGNWSFSKVYKRQRHQAAPALFSTIQAVWRSFHHHSLTPTVLNDVSPQLFSTGESLFPSTKTKASGQLLRYNLEERMILKSLSNHAKQLDNSQPVAVFPQNRQRNHWLWMRSSFAWRKQWPTNSHYYQLDTNE